MGDDAARADSASPDTVTILDTIDVPIVVVGPDCTLSRINRAAAEAFALAPIDIGRRLGAVAASRRMSRISRSYARRLLLDDAPSRHDIRSGDRRFLLRAAPYAIGPGQTAGAVLTFTNVTAFRASIEQAIYEREYTKAILNTITSPFGSVGLQPSRAIGQPGVLLDVRRLAREGAGHRAPEPWRRRLEGVGPLGGTERDGVGEPRVPAARNRARVPG